MSKRSGGISATSPPLRQAVPWLVGAALYGGIYAMAFLLISDISLGNALRWSAINVVPELALAPLVIMLTRRSAWGGVSPARFALVHALGAACFVAIAILVWLVIARLLVGGGEHPSPRTQMVWKGILSLLSFSALCGIGQAIEFGQRAREAVARAARAETLAVEARLAALRAQLNPHFILNLLHSLAGVAGRDAGRAATMIERLGDLLRYVVRVQNQDGDFVLFRDEWQFVGDYLSLESLRLGDRLRTELVAPADALDIPIPPFVVQPLVENAVRHSVAPRAPGGRIVVTARRLGDTLNVRVEDDGPGAAPDAPSRGSGAGLRLVLERIEAAYPGRGRVVTGRSPLGGFLVEVSIPVTGGEEEGSA